MRITVAYRELPQSVAQLEALESPKHYQKDPDNARYLGFAPNRKWFVNGEFKGELMPRLCPTSNTPFPENRVPRRGLVQVYPDDPDYANICREQGLGHLLLPRQTQHQNHGQYQKSPSLPNGVHPSPPMSHEEPTAEPARATSPSLAEVAH